MWMQYTTHGAAPRSTRTQRFLGGTMSLIGKEISDFSVQAYVNDDFKTVTKADVLGKCLCSSSIPQTSPLFAPLS